MTAREIGDRLHARMVQKKWTQPALAKAIDIDQSQISRVCNGKFKRLTGNVRRICEYANVPIGTRSKAGLSVELTNAIRELVGGSKLKEQALLRLIDAGSDVFERPKA
jgi:transcriptional regulator with XRE-family HTH domain